MNDHDPIPQEAYFPLSVLFTALGGALGIWGALNVQKGIENNTPALQEQGMHQIKMGRYFAFLSAYIKEGILPDPEIMKYLDAQ